jgi:hypothetical protein
MKFDLTLNPLKRTGQYIDAQRLQLLATERVFHPSRVEGGPSFFRLRNTQRGQIPSRLRDCL